MCDVIESLSGFFSPPSKQAISIKTCYNGRAFLLDLDFASLFSVLIPVFLLPKLPHEAKEYTVLILSVLAVD